MDQVHRGTAQDPASRQRQSRTDVHLRGGCLQSGADAESSPRRCLKLRKVPGHVPRHLTESRNHSQNNDQGKGIKPSDWFFRILLGLPASYNPNPPLLDWMEVPGLSISLCLL